MFFLTGKRTPPLLVTLLTAQHSLSPLSLTSKDQTRQKQRKLVMMTVMMLTMMILMMIMMKTSDTNEDDEHISIQS